MVKKTLRSNTESLHIGLNESFIECSIPPHLEGEFRLTEVDKIVALDNGGFTFYKINDDHDCPWARWIENNMKFHSHSRVDGKRIYIKE